MADEKHASDRSAESNYQMLDNVSLQCMQKISQSPVCRVVLYSDYFSLSGCEKCGLGMKVVVEMQASSQGCI